MTVRGNRVIVLALVLVATASPARATDVTALLGRVERAARFPVPARAEVLSDHGPALVLMGWRSVLRIEMADGTRFLLRDGRAISAREGRLRRLPVTTIPPGLPLALEDLALFRTDRLRMPQISDESPAGIVVTAAPAGVSNLALLVFTIDPDGAVVIKTQLYRGTINNMVTLRRETGFTVVDGRARPSTVTIDDIEHGTSTRWTLTWRSAPDLPEHAFTPAGLR